MPEFNKEEINKIKSDLIKLGLLYLASIFLIQIIFYNENFVSVFRVVTAFYILYSLPGMLLMYFWPKLPFIERFIIGIALGAAISGILSYYLNLLSIHLNYHAIITYILCIAISSVIIYRNLTIEEEKDNNIQ